MTGLPNFGDRVRIWPMPGRRVLAAPFPFSMDAPLPVAQYLPTAGREIVWDYYWHEQMKAGDILLHPPPCDDHDHGDYGVDDCRHCGRSLVDAQVYDVHYAHGVAAAQADAKEAERAAKAIDQQAENDRKKTVDEKQKAAAEAAARARAALLPPAPDAPAAAEKLK